MSQASFARVSAELPAVRRRKIGAMPSGFTIGSRPTKTVRKLVVSRLSDAGMIGQVRRSPHMFGEERQRAFAREVGAGGVVVLTLLAVEAVAGGIGVDRDLRHGGADAGDRRGRDVLVELAEMKLERRLRRLVQKVRDVAAVVADGGRNGKSASGEPDDVAAPAIADDADLAELLQVRDGGGGVAHRFFVAEALAHGAALGDPGFVIADIDIALDAVEERRRQGGVALGR